MGLLRDTGHDIFISYAHDDQLSELVGDGIDGWITAFGKKLEGALRKSLKKEQGEVGRTLDVFWDYRVLGDEPLDDQLRSAVEGSGIFIAVMSRSFLNSAWCQQEFEWFASVIEGQTGESVSTLQNTGRLPLMVVELAPTPREEWPPLLENTSSFTFFHKDSRYEFGEDDVGDPRYAFPSPDILDRVGEEYFIELNKLQGRITKRIQKLLRGEDPDPDPGVAAVSAPRIAPVRMEDFAPPRDGRRAVFVAPAAEELSGPLGIVQDELSALDLDVRTVPHGLPLEKLKDSLDSVLPHCEAFIQLLDATPKSIDDFAFVSRMMLQSELAARHCKEVHYWLPGSLTAEEIASDPATYSSLYANFVQGIASNIVQGETIEAFTQSVVEGLGPSEADVTPHSQTVDVFISTAREDLSLGKLIVDKLVTPGQADTMLTCTLPSGISDPTAYYQDWKENVLESDAVILVHGQAKRSWVRDQLKQIAQVLAVTPRNGHGLKIAILDAPPPPPINFAAAGIDLIDCNEGIDGDALTTFVKRLAVEKKT